MNLNKLKPINKYKKILIILLLISFIPIIIILNIIKETYNFMKACFKESYSDYKLIINFIKLIWR